MTVHKLTSQEVIGLSVELDKIRKAQATVKESQEKLTSLKYGIAKRLGTHPTRMEISSDQYFAVVGRPVE